MIVNRRIVSAAKTLVLLFSLSSLVGACVSPEIEPAGTEIDSLCRDVRTDYVCHPKWLNITRESLGL